MIKMEISQLNFRHQINGENLIIAVAQDHNTGEVLMVAYMNQEAVEKTLKTDVAHYWSTSRKKIWLKGESSGYLQKIISVKVDCDLDTILLQVEQEGGACHEGYYSCFFRDVSLEEGHEVKIVRDKVFDPQKIYGDK
jgi:phosphoribosyl-AMP cyclohydrolase